MKKRFYLSLMFTVVFTFGMAMITLAVDCPDKYAPSDGGLCLPSGTGLSAAGVDSVIKNFMNWLLGIFGTIAIISFAVSGVQYFSAAGDEKAAETAKNHMKWSIIGVIVGLSGYIILQAVDIMLGGLSTDF